MHNPNFSWLRCHVIFKHSCFIISIRLPEGNRGHSSLLGVLLEADRARCVIGLMVLTFAVDEVEALGLAHGESGLCSIFTLDSLPQGFVGIVSTGSHSLGGRDHQLQWG